MGGGTTGAVLTMGRSAKPPRPAGPPPAASFESLSSGIVNAPACALSPSAERLNAGKAESDHWAWERNMGPRTRKAIGSVGILLFLFFYVCLAGWIGDKLPNQWLVKLLFYAVVGTAWGAPLIPLLSWMNRGR